MRTYTPETKTTRPIEFQKRGNPDHRASGAVSDTQAILQLQRTIGNRAVQRLSRDDTPDRGKDLSARSAPPMPHTDAHEQEADRAADRVMRMPDPAARSGNRPSPEGRKAVPSPDRSLDATTREFMESRFGRDFSGVRVHTDEKAQAAARSVDAVAYTLGRDLVFGSGYYSPRTESGLKLLAHELSHVVQQRAPAPVADHDPGKTGPAPLRLTPVASPRIQMRRWGYGELPPMSGERFREAMIVSAMELVGEDAPTLGPALRRALEGDTAVEALVAILDDAERRSVGMTHIEQIDFASEIGARVVRAFILDPNTSSLDLLPEARRDRYRDFAWGTHDYPGGTSGTNEARARQMSRHLSEIRPERRANIGDTAVVTEVEHTTRVERHIRDNLVDIPVFPTPEGGGTAPDQPTGHRLYRNARESFIEMRNAALEDGVPLIIVSSYRDPEVARRNARAAGNPAAVASFSSHSLGLAVDLRMSIRYEDAAGQQQNLRYTETTTTPMQNVVDMRESPVHKWMFLHGAAYGWFPYQNEPWHWEYNPEGFGDQFNQALNPPQPEAEAETEPEEAPPSD